MSAADRPWMDGSRWTPEAFDEAFEGMPGLPADVRAAAEQIVYAYGMRGISDPGYIANVIAKNMGRGDGCSNFHPISEAV